MYEPLLEGAYVYIQLRCYVTECQDKIYKNNTWG